MFGNITRGIQNAAQGFRNTLGSASYAVNPMAALIGDSANRSANEQQAYNERINQLYGQGGNARQQDLAAGYAQGQKEFYDDPDMKQLRQRREDLSKGYSGQELGALRAQARGEIAGQRNQYLRQLQSNLARRGVAGARAAAAGGAADQGYARQAQEAERKMLLDNAQLTRQGTSDLQDFLFRQKYGKLGTGLGYAQLGVADRTGKAQAEANRPQERGLLGNLLGGLF